jgi:hypothetical protein
MTGWNIVLLREPEFGESLEFTAALIANAIKFELGAPPSARLCFCA